MEKQTVYSLYISGNKERMFAISDALGFESDLSALAISLFEDGANSMYLQALFASRQEAQNCARKLDLSGLEHFIDKLPDEDWVAKSQKGLPPVQAGRFFIYGSHDKDKIPVSCPYPILINAGIAFGTGHHGTTKGCLLAFEKLCAPRTRLKQISCWPKSILDLGCGSGVLAIAAAKALNRNILASDIDPDAIMATAENARINGVEDKIEAVIYDGVPKGYGGFDLVFANILARPLMAMAEDIAGILTPGGKVILSGILDEQAEKVIFCFEQKGLSLNFQNSLSGWTILVMAKPD